jgi:hypothetical protein
MTDAFDLMATFPGLGAGGLIEITSPKTPKYNCIAWAAGDMSKWWEADTRGIYYWPKGFARDKSVATLAKVFESMGYNPCDSPEHENGFEKVAIFTKPAGTFAHIARQLADGSWTSKMGEHCDISHTLLSLESMPYGKPTVFLKRKLAVQAAKA